MMKFTWIKACKVDCLKPSWRLMEFWSKIQVGCE